MESAIGAADVAMVRQQRGRQPSIEEYEARRNEEMREKEIIGEPYFEKMFSVACSNCRKPIETRSREVWARIEQFGETFPEAILNVFISNESFESILKQSGGSLRVATNLMNRSVKECCRMSVLNPQTYYFGPSADLKLIEGRHLPNMDMKIQNQSIPNITTQIAAPREIIVPRGMAGPPVVLQGMARIVEPPPSVIPFNPQAPEPKRPRDEEMFIKDPKGNPVMEDVGEGFFLPTRKGHYTGKLQPVRSGSVMKKLATSLKQIELED